MNPFIRKIVMQVLEKTARSAYQAYLNVNRRHGQSSPNLFEQFRAHLKTNPSAKMTVEEATKILSLDSNSKDNPYKIKAVF